MICAVLGCGPRESTGTDARAAEVDELLRTNKPREAAAVLERVLAGGANPALSARAGMIYAELGEWKRAAAHLERAQGPKADVGVASLLALARACSGDVAGARSLVPKYEDARKGTELAILVGAALASDAEQARVARDRLIAWRAKSKPDAPAELLVGIGALSESMRDAAAAREAYARVENARLSDPTWAAGLALVHQRQGRLHAAEVLLRRLLALHPEHREASLRLADVALASGDAALARSALAKVPQSGQSPLWLSLLRARTLMVADERKAACDLLTAALASPGDAADKERGEARLLRARCLATTGQLDAAERELVALAAQPALAVDAELQLAELQLARDRPKDAVTRLQALLAAHPEAAWAYYWLGRASEAQKDWAKAAFAYGAYLDRARGDRAEQRGEVLFRLAFVNKAQGNTAQAERLLEAALAANPESSEALRALVAGKPAAEALARVRKQIDLTVHTVPSRILLAELLHEQGHAAEAEQVHRETIAADPSDLRGHTAFANFYLKQGDRARAIEVLEAAHKREPEQRVVLAMLATAHAEGGQAARAAELYEALLVQTPSSVPVLNNLAFLYADTLDRPDQALAHARKAKALAPGWPEVSDTLGWVLAKRKEYSEALPLLEQAAKAMAKDPRVLFHLGAAQIGAGQREAGRRTLQRALQAGKPFPESEQAAQLLAAK